MIKTDKPDVRPLIMAQKPRQKRWEAPKIQMDFPKVKQNKVDGDLIKKPALPMVVQRPQNLDEESKLEFIMEPIAPQEIEEKVNKEELEFIENFLIPMPANVRPRMPKEMKSYAKIAYQEYY